ncbi:MAG: YidC/Oxa1 family insertase periplasmic-domain containing protein [Pirellulaceae bacterium]|nr:YidC/Oxa1 family insertase periplasmic-domain containing protein [Pirellulaceae bacterium]
MDRRFFTWMMLTTGLFFLYLSMQKPADVKPKPDGPAKADVVEKNPLLRDSNQAGNAELTAAEPSGALPEQETPAAAAVERAADGFPSRLVTLGSMDPQKKYSLLLTLNTAGASVERVEMVGQSSPGKLLYKSLEHTGGYLGYLGLGESLNGLRVRSVPDGSPAALARCADVQGGLQVDDLLLKIQDSTVVTPVDVEACLRTMKAGQVVELTIKRGEQELRYSTQLSQAPLDVLRSVPFASEVIPGNRELGGLRTTLAAIDGTQIPSGKIVLPALARTLEADWEVQPVDVPGGSGVQFRMPLQNMLAQTEHPKLELVKRYRLLPQSESADGFLLDLETSVVNSNDQPVKVALRQEGPTGLSLEGWWYSVKLSQSFFSGAGHRDVALSDHTGVHSLKTTRDVFSFAKSNAAQPHSIFFSEGEPAERRSLRYIGLDSQYFNASLMPYEKSPESLTELARAGGRVIGDVESINKSQIQAANIGFWIDTQEKSLAAGESFTQRYSIFIGPKDSQVLSRYGLELAIEYGWFPWVAKPLGWLLHLFYNIVGNYGLAIIMLTVCVRLAMFPLGRRAAVTGQRMQELQPEIKKINEKYPDNMEKRAKAMQELYRKHDFKPLAGCLPMFIQLPIFIGLYRCLSVDVSLRQEPLIPGLEWCSNLAGPDRFYDWSSWMPEIIAGRGTGWFGPYFNILPMVTVVLFLVQQKMLMPKATDPQTQMTQTMMKFMTIFMGVIFFKVPAGLCVYFITSSIWSLVERQIVKRTLPPPNTAATADSAAAEPPLKPRGRLSERERREIEPDKPSAMEKWRSMLDKPSVRSGTQRGQSSRKRKKKGS